MTPDPFEAAEYRHLLSLSDEMKAGAVETLMEEVEELEWQQNQLDREIREKCRVIRKLTGKTHAEWKKERPRPVFED
jgi:hypothetical protein